MENKDKFDQLLNKTIYKDIINTIISVATLCEYKIDMSYHELVTNTKALVIKLQNNTISYAIVFAFKDITLIKITIEINGIIEIENKSGFMIAESLQKILEEL